MEKRPAKLAKASWFGRLCLTMLGFLGLVFLPQEAWLQKDVYGSGFWPLDAF